MHLEKRWIYIVFVLALFPTPAYAQLVSLSKPASGKYNFRLGYAREFGGHGMWLGMGRGFSDRTEISTNILVFFNQTNQTLEGLYESSQFVHSTPLGSTGIDCFFFGDYAVWLDRGTFIRSYARGFTGRTLRSISITRMWLGGGGGLSKTLGQFTAFASLFYQRNVYARNNEFVETWLSALSIGAEIEITQYMDLTGKVDGWYAPEVGFLSPPAFYIGLSLH